MSLIHVSVRPSMYANEPNDWLNKFKRHMTVSLISRVRDRLGRFILECIMRLSRRKNKAVHSSQLFFFIIIITLSLRDMK